MTEPQVMSQSAPYPVALGEMVQACTYRPGWRVHLRSFERDPGCVGLTLVVVTHGYNSYHPEDGESYDVRHYFSVPAATYDDRSWRRWLFEQFLLVERHEAAEFFQLDGERPYAPVHAPGADPYLLTELSTGVERRTSFRGELNPG